MQPQPMDVTPVLVLLPPVEENIVYETPVINLTFSPTVSPKDLFLKRSFDIVFSLAVMLFGAPVFLLLYLVTKFSSKGPAFFKQERLGKLGKPFTMYKFRSMYVDAEKFGPRLSSANDPRITKWGRIIRSTRLDELPQFWNVLKGEMTIVGPRPERRHFAKKIIARNPDYKKLSYLKPGLTSIGQVAFGYAESVDEMCTRVRYDLLYLNNVSFEADMRIIFQTVKVMLQKKGK
ncbi:MAG TPA: sugar transferase [Mucilaginibacter sp.]|jgi:putative colanic acid biosynthesis UDP-glucose lipid carrier transferase|nr:sugar transferase [Mucilaginibacter sp.]